MRASLPSRLALLVAAGMLGASCSSDSGTGPGQTPPVDLAQALGEMTPRVLASPGVTAVMPIPVATLVSAPVPSSCSYSTASQSFVCPTTSTSGLTFSRSFKLFTAANTPQSQFDPATTASVESILDAAGTFGTGTSAMNVTQHQDMTLSGLLTGAHLLNGVATMHMTGSPTGLANGLDLLVTTTTTDLAVPTARSGNQWPASGTITSVVSDNSFSSSPFTTSITMKFNGTSTVALTMTTGGHTQSCSMDLASTQLPACFATLYPLPSLAPAP
jgi:hypothetical protein